MSSEFPTLYRHHLFMCTTERPAGHPRGSCGQQGVKLLWEHLARRVDALGDPEIGITASGCLGFCAAGPILVVYPEGLWYLPRSMADIDEIVQVHLVEGRPVERLAVLPRR